MTADRDAIRQYVLAWYEDMRHEGEEVEDFFTRMASKRGIHNPYEAQRKEKEERMAYVAAMASKANKTSEEWMSAIEGMGMRVARGAGGRFCLV